MLEPTRRPLRSRPLDAIYAAWFPLHIVIMLCVDMTTIYPQWMIPAPLSALREWQATNYKDRFFIDPPPPWFTLFIYLEALYHVPLSIWATRALIRDSPTVPLHLLIWSLETAITTLVCIVDYSSWENFSTREVYKMHSIYGPYFVLAVAMAVDMFLRLRTKSLDAAEAKTKEE